MKKLILIIVLLITVVTIQSQTLSIFDASAKTSITTHNWTAISSPAEQMTIGTLSVEFVTQKARLTHSTNVINHITKSSHTSPEGKIIKGLLYDEKGTTIGIARFSKVGNSMAGTADIGNDTYKFRPDKDGNYYWELEAPFNCGTEEEDHNGLQNPAHKHTEDCHHNDASSLVTAPSSMRDPQSCTTESVQDVAFVTDDLMDEYGNDLDAILAQFAISDNWAEDIMTDSGFPDIAFFQESVNVVEFAESGTTWYNLQAFSDSLYADPPGIIASIMQSATSTVTVLYSLGGGGYSGVALISVNPMPSGQYYLSVLGDNGGLGNRIKIHEYGHSLWGGEHEDLTPNPVLYRRAYLGTDGTWGNYVTTMAQGNFGGGVRIYRFSESDPTASWYSEALDHTFTPVGTADRDMGRRITEEWNRDGIILTVDITPVTPTISPDGPTDFCDGESVELSVDTPESGVEYIWTNGETGNSIVVTDAETYSCYGEASPTCSGASSNEIIVTVNALPTPTITGDDEVCDNGTGSYSTESSSSFTWSIDPPSAGTITLGQGTSSIDVEWADSGDVVVDVTNANGCEGSSVPFSVTVNALPTPTITGDDAVCDGSDGSYSTETYSTYSWSIDPPSAGTITSGQGTNSIIVNWDTSGDVIVDVTSADGCPGDEIFSVTVNDNPSPAITGDDEICESNDGSYSVGTFSTYSWSIDPPSAGTIVSGQGTNSITINWNTTGDVIVDVTNNDNCSGTDLFGVTVNESPITNAGNDQSIPYGTSTNLEGSATGGDGSYDYLWSPDGLVVDPTDPNTETVNLNSPETFTLDVTDGNGCISSDDVYINVTGGPLGLNPEVDPDVSCGNTQVQLTANAFGGSENYSYSWSADPAGFTSTQANPTDTPTVTTTYYCEVDDGNNSETGEIMVTVYSEPIADAGADIGLEVGHSIQFEGIVSGGSGDLSILWEGVDNTIPIDNPTIVNPNVGPFPNIDVYYFTMTVTDNITGCYSVDEMFVDVILEVSNAKTNDISIYPNPFTNLVNIEVQKGETYSLTIINSEGQIIQLLKIHESQTVNTTDFPKGLYLFILQNTISGERFTKKLVKR